MGKAIIGADIVGADLESAPEQFPQKWSCGSVKIDLRAHRVCARQIFTGTSSGMQRELWMDLAASSAVNLPIVKPACGCWSSGWGTDQSAARIQRSVRRCGLLSQQI